MLKAQKSNFILKAITCCFALLFLSLISFASVHKAIHLFPDSQQDQTTSHKSATPLSPKDDSSKHDSTDCSLCHWVKDSQIAFFSKIEILLIFVFSTLIIYLKSHSRFLPDLRIQFLNSRSPPLHN